MSNTPKDHNKYPKKILANKAKVALRQFEQAVRDDATKGIQDPSDRKEIADLLKVKRNNLARMLPWVDKPLKESSSD